MGLLDKLKNALFEEEYVEVEEKPKNKVSNKLKARDVIKEKIREEKPVAKKIILPEKKESRIEEDKEEESYEESFNENPGEVIDLEEPDLPSREIVEERPNNFRVIEDEDLVMDEPQIVKVIDNDRPTREKQNAYQEPARELYSAGERVNQPYGVYETPRSTVNDYGGYESKREEKTFFKPSPIISPIYGILDKNYRKEDVVTKKEVRLVSSYAKDKLSVDDVRKKAFEKTPEIASLGEEKEEEVSNKFEVEESDNLLVDLTKDEDKPAVKEVTMGDALEYFEDLGLEYNVDYVDAGGQHSRRKKQEEVVPSKEDEKEDDTISTKATDEDNDDNLFDLIDSMYQEQE